MRYLKIAFLFGITCLAAACGDGYGGGYGYYGGPYGGGGGYTPPPSGGSGTNTVPVEVTSGPAGAGGTVNTLYTTVTVCAPGSTSQCSTIDNVQVDTGSTGFRILAPLIAGNLTTSALPLAVDGAGNTIEECLQFADGYTWGTVRSADIHVGSYVAAGTPIQVIADPAAAAAPASCVSGPVQNTVATLGANAILGVGNFLTDCGEECAAAPVPGTYYGCAASTGCQPEAITQTMQLQNPVSLFATDNNGVVIELPSVSAPGASVSGTMVFGINTQADNALGSAQIYTLDPNYGTFTTTFNGTVLDSSFIDSASNAYLFTDDSIPLCTSEPTYYCPATLQSMQASIQGTNGAASNIPFAVANVAADFGGTTPVLPALAGPAVSGQTNAFDWGLPFFYGRNVYVAFELGAPDGVPGPWVGF